MCMVLFHGFPVLRPGASELCPRVRWHRVAAACAEAWVRAAFAFLVRYVWVWFGLTCACLGLFLVCLGFARRFPVVSCRSVHRFVIAHGGALVKLEQLSWRAEAATVSASVQCAHISGRQLQQQDRRALRARVACRVSALRSFQLSSQGMRQSRACSVGPVPGSQNHAERALL